MQKTLYFLYLIPEHDKRGDYYYTGMTKQPIEREHQHDAKRYLKRCHFCHGEGKRWEFMVFEEKWVENECFLCRGYGKIKGNRKKRDRMHVVPYFGIRANWDKNMFGDFCVETLSEILTWERNLKKIQRNDKDEIYRAGLLPEELMKRIEEAETETKNLPDSQSCRIIYTDDGTVPSIFQRIKHRIIYKDWRNRTT
jgi:predicted GIY-YIG superfamily endonuclease